VSGKTERVAAAAPFVLIGAGAHTGWLKDTLQRDEHGYVKTGRHVNLGIGGLPEWDEDRARGVTAAVYEGTTAVWSAREYLAEE
jgi:alkyl hydroperoxide reductase subunit AhpF